jgi:hypothetical protein
MNIVRESISFQRGADPKDALGIGIVFHRNFDTFDEAAQFFFDNIDKLSDGVCKSQEHLIYNALLEKSFIGVNVSEKNFSVLKLCKDYLDGFGKYPPVSIKEGGGSFETAEWKLAFLKDFRLVLMEICKKHAKLAEYVSFKRGLSDNEIKNSVLGYHPGQIITRKGGGNTIYVYMIISTNSDDYHSIYLGFFNSNGEFIKDIRTGNFDRRFTETINLPNDKQLQEIKEEIDDWDIEYIKRMTNIELDI